jgi:hypothetical protein
MVLDHLAHFVPDLDAAAAVWEKLGFVVTPVSHHRVAGKPAGTSNRCVMLDEGYLELLAPDMLGRQVLAVLHPPLGHLSRRHVDDAEPR